MSSRDTLREDIRMLREGIRLIEHADPIDAYNSGAYKRAMQRVLDRKESELRQLECNSR